MASTERQISPGMTHIPAIIPLVDSYILSGIVKGSEGFFPHHNSPALAVPISISPGNDYIKNRTNPHQRVGLVSYVGNTIYEEWEFINGHLKFLMETPMGLVSFLSLSMVYNLLIKTMCM